MSEFVGPELLGDEHLTDGFDCGDATLNQWLTQRARRNQVQGASRTWIISLDGRANAYYASSTAVVLRAEATPGRHATSPTRSRHCC